MGIGRRRREPKVVQVKVRMGQVRGVGCGTGKNPAVRRDVSRVRGVEADERPVARGAVRRDGGTSIARRRLHQPRLERLDGRERGLARSLIAGQSTACPLKESLVCPVVLVGEATVGIVWSSVASLISVYSFSTHAAPKNLEITQRVLPVVKDLEEGVLAGASFRLCSWPASL